MAKIATWLFNEGAGTVVSDSEGNGNGIVVNFNGQGAWVNNGEGAGISSTKAPSTGGATTAQLSDIASNGTIGSSLNGATQLTLYVVANIINGNTVQSPNLFRIGPSNGFSDFSVVFTGNGAGGNRALTVRWGRISDGGGEMTFPNLSAIGSPAQNEAIAFAFKINTEEPAANDRVKVWYNGLPQSVSFSGVPIAINTALNSVNNTDRGVYFLNDGENDTKNLESELYYGQIFDTLVDDAQIISDSAALLLNNDVDPTGADNTDPVLTLPTGVAVTATTATGTVSTNESTGTLFFLSSTNASENEATVLAASSQSVSASGVQNVAFSGLTAETNYYNHFAHTDGAGNTSAVASSSTYATPAPADNTDPILTSPTGTPTGQTTATGTVSTNEATGSLFFIASANASENEATLLAASSQSVTLAGVQNVNFTGLAPGSTLFNHYLHRDLAGNSSLVSSSASYQTAAPAFSISSLTPATLRVGDTATITLVGASATGKTLSIPSGSIAVATQNATTITFAIPDPNTHGTRTSRYAVAIPITVTDGSDNGSVDMTISIAATREAFGAVGTAAPTGAYANDSDLQTGDFVHWRQLTGLDAIFDPGTGLTAVGPGGGTAEYAAFDGVWSDYEPIVYNNPVGVSAPAVTSQPVSRTLQEGSGVTVSFTAGFSGSPTPTIQWQKDDKGNGVFADIAGETSATISIQGANVNAIDNNGDQYRAVATNTQGTATSVQVILTVTAPSIEAPAFTGLIGTQSNTIGDNVYLDFSASWDGSPTTYAITSGVLPSNLIIGNDGVVSGPLDTVQTLQNIVVTASNSAGSSSSNAFSWVVNGSITNPTFVGNVANRTNVTGDSVSFDLSPNWVNNPSSYEVTAGSLPSGLSVSDFGVVSGIVGASGLSTGIIVTATNSAGSDPSNAFSWNVLAVAIAPEATVVGVVDVIGNAVNRVYTDWYLTDSNINLSNKSGQPINVVSSGANLSVINGTARVDVPSAIPGQTYTLVAWIAGAAQNASTHYFRDVNVTITAGS